MWCLDSMGYKPHRHLNSSQEKNLSQYSPIGAWLTIALVALVHNELEWPKNLSHEPPLAAYSSIEFEFSSRRFIKLWPLVFDAWNDIFQLLRIESYLLFLLKSHNNLHRKIGKILNSLVSLSTLLWRGHLWLLGQSQNSMKLLLFLLKNTLSSLDIAAN